MCKDADITYTSWVFHVRFWPMLQNENKNSTNQNIQTSKHLFGASSNATSYIYQLGNCPFFEIYDLIMRVVDLSNYMKYAFICRSSSCRHSNSRICTRWNTVETTWPTARKRRSVYRRRYLLKVPLLKVSSRQTWPWRTPKYQRPRGRGGSGFRTVSGAKPRVSSRAKPRATATGKGRATAARPAVRPRTPNVRGGNRNGQQRNHGNLEQQLHGISAFIWNFQVYTQFWNRLHKNAHSSERKEDQLCNTARQTEQSVSKVKLHGKKWFFQIIVPSRQ